MKKSILNYTIGSDIETFLQDKASGEIISAEPFIRGTKDDPARFSGDWFTTQLDNVLAEFTIPPSNKREDFVNSICFAKDYLNTIIPPHLKTLFIPANNMDEKFLQTENAQTFGCSPSFSVWTLQQIDIMRDLMPNLRSAGAHIHVGYDDPNDDTSLALIKALDLFLGAPSTLIEPENMRRLLYGKAGEFRMKSYGTEYRTLSSYFADSNELMAWMYDGTERAIAFINEGGEVSEATGLLIQDAINNSNKTAAQQLREEFQIQLP